MLAQNFKTPGDLGITDKEWTALVSLLGMLERNELRHADLGELEATFGFNMSDYANPCGTVCCMAGWSDRLFGTNFENTSGSNELDDLFCMFGQSLDVMDRTTAQEAAHALRNYLTNGDPAWRAVLGCDA